MRPSEIEGIVGERDGLQWKDIDSKQPDIDNPELWCSISIRRDRCHPVRPLLEEQDTYHLTGPSLIAHQLVKRCGANELSVHVERLVETLVALQRLNSLCDATVDMR